MNWREICDRVEHRMARLGLRPKTLAPTVSESIRNLKRLAEGKSRAHSITLSSLAKIAESLDTSLSWLLEGVGDEEGARQRRVEIKGYVGAGAAGHIYAVAQGALDEIDLPDLTSPSIAAAEIKGTSIGRHFDRWVAVYDDVRRPVTDDIIGRLCVVGLGDERILIKKIRRNKKRFDLLSHDEDPILDVDVTWAAPVKFIMPKS